MIQMDEGKQNFVQFFQSVVRFSYLFYHTISTATNATLIQM